jgi:hypothetical protein
MDGKTCLPSPQNAGRHRDPHGVLSGGCKGSLLAQNWLGCGANHSGPSVSEVKNEWSKNVTLCVSGAHGVICMEVETER